MMIPFLDRFFINENYDFGAFSLFPPSSRPAIFGKKKKRLDILTYNLPLKKFAQ